MNLKKSVLGMSLAASMGLAASANAAFVLDDVTIDFTSVGGPVVMGVDSIGFNEAPFVAVANGDGTYTVTGKGAASSLLSDFDGDISPLGLGATGFFELTFDFSLQVSVDSFVGGILSFSHLAGPSALRFYLDDLDVANADGGVKATPGSGAGYTDGTLVLTFDVQGVDGGLVDLAGTLDGSDDALFEVSIVNTTGIFLTEDGDEFTVGSTLAITDSNFDLDSNNNNVLDETRGGFGCTAANQSAVFFCGVEDGTVRFAVPEPGTLAIMGLGLLGLGLTARRKSAV